MKTISLTDNVKDEIEVIKRNLNRTYKGDLGRVKVPQIEIHYQHEGNGEIRVLDICYQYERQHFFTQGQYPRQTVVYANWLAALAQVLEVPHLWIGHDRYRFVIDQKVANRQAYLQFKDNMRRLFNGQIFGEHRHDLTGNRQA